MDRDGNERNLEVASFVPQLTASVQIAPESLQVMTQEDINRNSADERN